MTTDAKTILRATITEKDLQGFIATLARLHGWLVYHTYDSRRSEAGFPDLTMVRGARVIFAELKSERGKVTQAQQTWLDALAGAGTVEVHVWRPSDLDDIEEILR